MSLEPGDLGVLTTDQELVVRSWDAWLVAATGIPAEVASGRALLDLFPEVGERGLAARLHRVAQEGAVEVLAPAFHQYLIPCAPRAPTVHYHRMQQHVTLSPLRAGEAIVGITVTIRDVTARRERERALAEKLDSPDEATRLHAVEALAAADASPDILVGAFEDASWRVRGTAVDAAARYRGEEGVQVLVRLLREQHRDLAVLNATLSSLAASGEEALPALLELMQSPDVDLRVYVALALGLRGDLAAVPVLVRALEDEDTNVRFHALEALGRLGARAAVPRIAEIVETRDFALAFAGLEALAEIGDETVAPRVLPLLDDEMLRPAALAALGRLGGEEAVAPVAALLARDDVSAAEVSTTLAAIHTRYEAGFGDGEVIARLAVATVPAGGGWRLAQELPTAAGAERAAIARVLGWLGVDGSEEALARALGDPKARSAAVEGLVRLGPRAVGALGSVLGELDGDAVRAAAAALGRIGSSAAVPTLLEHLDSEAEIAIAAADALGRIGDGGAFEPLLALLARPEAAVRQAAIGALSSIGHPALRGRVPELLGSPSATVRESAARIAGYFGYDECVDQLLGLCGDPEESVRRAAIEHLVHLDDPRVPGALRDALRAGSGPTRAAAARALARLAPADAAPLLSDALDDPDLWVRFYAARSAASHRLTALASRLVELARHDRAVPVRIAALEAVGAIGVDEGVPVLAALAAEQDPELRLAALTALARTGHPAATAVLRPAIVEGEPTTQWTVTNGMTPSAAAALATDLAAAARVARDPEVARAAASALVRSGSGEAARLLCSLAGEPGLREICVQALAALPAGLSHVLAEELGAGDEGVRDAVLAALAHRRAAEAERIAAGALRDPSPRVRQAAAHTLCRLDLRAAVVGD